MAKITKKQQKFIDEYMKDLNATQAAIRAGYSARSARATASRMLTKDNIRVEVEKRMTVSRLSSDAVIAHLSYMAQGLTPTKEVITDGEVTAYYDVLAANDKMGRIYALFVDKQVIELEGLEIIDDDEEG